jgi:hypothetical protein
MKAIFLLILLSIPVFAQSVDLSQLPADKQQQILQIAQQSNQQAVTPENVSKWAEVGIGVGKAISSTAKELGVEANVFAQTPLGKLALALVIWYFVGQKLLYLAVLILFLTATIRIAFKFYNLRYTYVYEDRPVLWSLFTVKRLKEKSYNTSYRATDSETTLMVIFFVMSLMLVLITILTGA